VAVIILYCWVPSHVVYVTCVMNTEFVLVLLFRWEWSSAVHELGDYLFRGLKAWTEKVASI
jgi:hypothetical protein